MLRRTPCVGICSTTYGDLVCRGCKRFAHEIVQWNGFDENQRSLVWERLYRLREGALLQHATIDDESRLRTSADRFGVPERSTLSPANLAYEVLRRSRNTTDVGALGLVSRAGTEGAAALYQRVEREFLDRSVAQYERDFRVQAR